MHFFALKAYKVAINLWYSLLYIWIIVKHKVFCVTTHMPLIFNMVYHFHRSDVLFKNCPNSMKVKPYPIIEKHIHSNFMALWWIDNARSNCYFKQLQLLFTIITLICNSNAIILHLAALSQILSMPFAVFRYIMNVSLW